MKQVLAGCAVFLLLGVMAVSVWWMVEGSADVYAENERLVVEATTEFCGELGLFPGNQRHFKYHECIDDTGFVSEYLKPEYWVEQHD